MSIDTIKVFDKPINTRSYWNARFSSKDWENNQGKQRTLFFGQLAIDNIPSWLKVYIESKNLSICDFGCALGQATKLLTTTFPNNDVTGQDISELGIKEAKRIFPELKFTSEDLLQTTEEKYDVLFSSNTLEHFYDPHDIVSKLANSTRNFLIFLLPFYDDLKIKEHFYSFTYQNIPRVIADKFSLLFYKEIDTSRIPNTYWNGKQILLVYAIDSVIDILETNANNLIPCNASKKECRLILIDSILKAESERKVSEFLSFPIKQHLEQSLAQEQAEHQATKQHLEQTENFRNYVLNSFSWKIVKPLRLLKRTFIKINKKSKLACNLFKTHGFKKFTAHVKQYGLVSTVKYTRSRLSPKIHAIKKSELKPSNMLLEKQQVTLVRNALKEQKNSKNCIIFQLAFFDFNGEKPINGGAERYCVDLANLLKERQLNVVLVQMGNTKLWIKKFNSLTVIGLPVRACADVFTSTIAGLEELATISIYSPFSLSPLKGKSKSIGIIHSMFWDHPERLYFSNIDEYMEKIKSCDLIVSNSITTINWIRGYKGTEFAKNMYYIPNYVDLSEFKADKNLERRHDKHINILFPRRITKDRGFEYVVHIFPKIFEKYPNVNLTLAGYIHNDQKVCLHHFIKNYGNRVQHIESEPNKMVGLYQESDIVLIPTPYTEGTSLSCLEAMACGKAIITTNIGGLPELIINGYNGVIVNPCEDELYESIVCLIEDRKLRLSLANKAKELAQSFSLTTWRNLYTKHIDRLLKHNNEFPCDYRHSDVVVFEKFMPWSFEYTQRFHHIPSILADYGYKCIFVGFEHHDQLVDGDIKKIKENLLLTTDKSVHNNIQGITRTIHYFNCCAKDVLHVNYLKFLHESNQLIIYDYCDHIHKDIFLSEVPENVLESQNYCLKNSSIIILSSASTLYEHAVQIRGSNHNVYLVENAVNKNNFMIASDCKSLTDLNFLIDKTVIGYFGAVANWFDYELVSKISDAYPNHYIVIIGIINDKLFKQNRLNMRSNIIAKPPVAYNELMHYANYFNISIIPFLNNEIIRSCSPVKLFEYMALGKPIITTDILECRKYKSALIAKDHDEFISLIDKALKIPEDDDYFKIMKKEAEENTWDARAKVIIEAINENLNAR